MSASLTRALRAVAVVAFVAAAAWRVTAPGLHYDEVLFVNAALGGIDDVFVHRRLFGVPVMTMEYLGALKAWLYAPVFALFGVSAATIRLPAVALAGLALYLYALLAERLFGRGLGLLFLAVLATDPALFLMSRFDWGPFVLMTLLKAASLLAFFAWLERPSGARPWLLLVLLALGVFDKLNFVWFALGLVVAALAVYPRAVWRAQRLSGLGGWTASATAVAVGAYVGGRVILPLLAAYETPTLASGGLSSARVFEVWDLVRNALEGGGLWGVLLLGDSPERALTSLGLSLALLACLPLLARGEPRPGDPALGGLARRAVFFTVLAGVIFLQMAATPQTSGPHHGVMLLPFPLLIAFAVLGRGIERAGSHERLAVAAAGALCALLVAVQVGWIATYLVRIGDPRGYQAWADPAIYELARALRDERADAFVSVDWGLHTQLFALARPEDRRRYRDLWAPLNAKDGLTPAQRERILAEDFTGRRVVVITHAPEATIMQDARAAFKQLESDALVATAPVRTIRNAAGRPIYELRAVRAR